MQRGVRCATSMRDCVSWLCKGLTKKDLGKILFFSQNNCGNVAATKYLSVLPDKKSLTLYLSHIPPLDLFPPGIPLSCNQIVEGNKC